MRSGGVSLPEEIETERLTLRRPRASDAGPMSLYAGDRRVALMLTRVPHPYPPGAAEAFIERARADRLSEHVWVLDAGKIEGPEFVGAASLKPKGARAALGYWVGPPFWNTGYASEAAKGIVAAARAAGLAGLDAEIAEGNEASAHVLVNVGFVETGTGEAFGVAAGRMLAMRRFALEFAEDAR